MGASGAYFEYKRYIILVEWFVFCSGSLYPLWQLVNVPIILNILEHAIYMYMGEFEACIVWVNLYKS